MSVLLIGYNESALSGLDRYAPRGSVLVLEEPDLWRDKGLAAKAGKHPSFGQVFFGRYQQDQQYAGMLAGLPPFEAVIPGMEYAVEAAADLAVTAGLPGAGPAAAAVLRDKLLLRQATVKAGMAAPEFREVRDAGDIAELAAAGDCVVKPAGRQASLGVIFVGPGDDPAQAWRFTRLAQEKNQLAHRAMDWRYLAERRLEGPEFSTEVLVRQGEPVFVNVTRKQTLPGRHPVESGHLVPGWPAADPGEPWSAAVGDLIAAVTFGTGILHAEWVLTGDGPVLVECAGRLPGDRIIDLIDLAYDTNVVRLWVDLLSGRPATPPRPAARAAAIKFLIPRAGLVRQVTGEEQARAVPGVRSVDLRVTAGDALKAPESSWDRAGSVLAVAAQAREAEAAAAAALSRITITYQDGSPPPEPPAPGPARSPAANRVATASQPAAPQPAAARAVDLRGRTLLVLGASSPSRRGLLAAAKRRGARIVLVKHQASWERAYCDAVLDRDCDDHRCLGATVAEVTAFARAWQVTGVVTAHEAVMPVLAEVAWATGLPGPAPELIRRLRDKAQMRERFSELGLPSAASIKASTLAEVTAAAAAIGMPVIVKPMTGSGSLGVQRADDLAGLSRAYDLLSEVYARAGRALEVVVEEFIDGREVCVDAVVYDGSIIFDNILDKPSMTCGPFFEELEFITPSDLSRADTEAARELNARLLGGLGVQAGIGHTEMKLAAGGWRLIETHLRTAGQRLPDIVARAANVDLFGAAVELAMGERPHLEPRRNCYAGYRCVYSARPGVLRAIHGLGEAERVPGITGVEIATPVGERLTTVPTHAQQNVAYIRADGPDYGYVRQQLAAALQLIQVAVD